MFFLYWLMMVFLIFRTTGLSLEILYSTRDNIIKITSKISNEMFLMKSFLSMNVLLTRLLFLSAQSL